MRIELNHVAKIEGHGSLIAKLNRGAFADARFSTLEGSRLIEGILLNRDYSDAPLITSRICGVCPVIHNLTSIAALEDALGIRVSPAVQTLRRIMLAAQVIHSHSLHAYLMCLPDYFAVPGAAELATKQPALAAQALELREFGNRLIAVIGGRSVHPINSQVGGFLRAPDAPALRKLRADVPKLIASAEELTLALAAIPYPKFSRRTEYLGLTDGRTYPYLRGTITSSWSGRLTPKQFLAKVREEQLPGQLVKRTRLDGKVYLLGALARLNLNSAHLPRRAKRLFQSLKFALPIENTYLNIFAQSLEILVALEAIEQDLPKYLRAKPVQVRQLVRVRAGQGAAAMEAPRGTLFHMYTLNKYGRLTGVNIITPTAQFINNLEADVSHALGRAAGFTKQDEKRITMLVRAYDPCMTCATH